ncbi:MAG: conjugal transfer protein TraG [Sulfobacillus benefaciens]|uniref:Conjugal transfer protein TraG n=1 Tax=Sulfobacillus benefaciens TaxID=453960 RepID=A0A2T2XII3_9FIRM|nr:MAG: conjugal transfer protein TraG [Sulfobacillus benefaciens]
MRLQIRWIGPAWWIALGFWTAVALMSMFFHWIHPSSPPFVSARLGVWWLAILGVGLVVSYTVTKLKALVAFVGLLLVTRVSWLLIPVALVFGVGVILFWQKNISDHAVVIGRRWKWWPVTLSTADRYLHLHVIGPTGAGKSSSVLLPLIAQDLKAGRPVALLEPKGDLSQAAYNIAVAYHHHLIHFNPEDPRCPHYNPLAGPSPASAAEGISWALNQIAESGHPFYAVSSRVLLMYAVIAVKEALGDRADLDAVLRFLRRDTEQQAVLKAVKDPRVVQYFGEQMNRLNPRVALEQRQGLLNRLELLLLHPDVRRVLSPPFDFDWDQVLAEKITVLCPLSLARLGASARMLGTLLWHGLAMATYRRPLTGHLPPYFLFLDEFHEFVTPDLGEFLALARGYHLGLTLAHQDFGQLTPELKEALLANGRQKIVLGGIAPEDFNTFKASASPFPIDSKLRFFPPGQAWVQLITQGKPRRPQRVQLPYHPLGDS